MTILKINVRGLPHPQGSLKAFKRKDGGIATTYPAGVYQWRSQVQQAAAEASLGMDPIKGPIQLNLGFDLPRIKGHFGTGRNAEHIKPSAPEWPIVSPDLDKLIRAISDALTDAGVWKDDAQVVIINAAKRYTTTPPGVLIQIQEL